MGAMKSAGNTANAALILACIISPDWLKLAKYAADADFAGPRFVQPRLVWVQRFKLSTLLARVQQGPLAQPSCQHCSNEPNATNARYRWLRAPDLNLHPSGCPRATIARLGLSEGSFRPPRDLARAFVVRSIGHGRCSGCRSWAGPTRFCCRRCSLSRRFTSAFARRARSCQCSRFDRRAISARPTRPARPPASAPLPRTRPPESA